ncbi:MAG: substrate-binding domain-containing protein [Ignavibacteriales bacterium]|nr:substrate-binding domain-containing protein [Ignavibacteriales bacterium]
MTNREIKVVIAVPTFGSAFQISMIANFRKLFKPEEMALRSSTEDAEKQMECLHQLLIQNKPTALIAMDIRPDFDTISTYRAANVPIVIFDEEAAGVSTIATDNFKGGRIAGEYLISKGRNKIAIVTGRTQVKGGYNAVLRLKGFQQALKAKGLSIPQGCVMEVMHYSREDGVEVMPKLLALGVDAVFCAAGDNCAQGLLNVAKDKGVRVPEDVAIVGFDDLLIARLSTPTLTTIRQPLMEMAEAAYTMVVIQRDEILRNPQNAIFNPELIIRKSA